MFRLMAVVIGIGLGLMGLFLGVVTGGVGALLGLAGAFFGIIFGFMFPLAPLLFLGLVIWLLVRPKTARAGNTTRA